MNVLKTLDDLTKDHGFLRDVQEDLMDLYALHGQPSIPSGPSTDVSMPHSVLVDDLGDETTEEDVEAYNTGIERLYECAGITHIGSNMWIGQYEAGSDEWAEYRRKAIDLIEYYLSMSYYDNFIQWRW